MSAPIKALRYVLLLVGLFNVLPQVAQAQAFDVENQQFPGAKRVKIESFGRGPSGFWAEYKLDEQGWATERKGYRRRHLNLIERYSFTSRRKLRQEKIYRADDKRAQVFRYSYQYSPDSARLIRKIGLSDADTMYVFHFLEFDLDNRPTKFTKAKGLRHKAASLTELTYANGREATYRRTDYNQQDTTVYTCVYQYNTRGDLIKENRAISPKPPVNFWMDGSGDEREYSYDYSPRGPWIRQYQLFGGKKALITKRTITY